MRTIYSIILFIGTLSGCTKKAETIALTHTDTTRTATMPAATDSLTYLALGDSYTIGQSVPLAQSFPFQLTAQLKADTINVKTPKIIATTGWTTDQLIDAINRSDINGKKYDFVTLLIGVNDQFGGYSQANYRIKFVQVLNTAIAFANGNKKRVFVVSIPDYGVTPFAGGNDAVIGPQIDQFNAINKDESTKAGVHYVEITDISRTAATDPTLIANDGLHPSGAMYALWIKRLAPAVAASLKK